MRPPLRSSWLLPVALLLAVPASALADGRPVSSRRARTAVKASPRRVISHDALRRQGGPSTAPTPEQRLREELDGIWAGRILRRGVTAIYVVDARTGQDVYAVHPDDKVNPASNVKLLSTATVLDLMGPEWRYLTRLFGPSVDRAGVARGDLYLRGNADPTLTASALDKLAAAVARSGVKRVEGDVVLSDDLLRDTIAAPRITVRVEPAKAGQPPRVTVEPASSYIQLHVDAVTTTRRRARLAVTTELVDATSAPATPALTPAIAPTDGWADGPRLLVRVGGTIRKGRVQSHRKSVRLRSTFTGYSMRAALRAAGVEVTGRVRLESFESYAQAAVAAGYLPVELARHQSGSMQEMVARVNKRSNNYLADRLLMTAGAERAGGGPPSMRHGIDAMYRWLAQNGVDPRDVVVDTGSGLSHRTQLTARHLVRVLRTAAGYGSVLSPQSLLDPRMYLATLSVGGVDGTLRGRFRSETLRGLVLGKTGTLRDSVALSGFVSAGGDDALCFAIVTNGNKWNARYRVRREHDQMVAAMQRYLDARRARLDLARATAQDRASREAELVGSAVRQATDRVEPAQAAAPAGQPVRPGDLPALP